MNPATSVMAPGWPLLILPVVVAAAVLGLVGGRGVSVFKKQGVAWGLTALMIVAAIGIGYGKAHASNVSEPAPDYQQGPGTAPNAAAAGYFVLDDAGVLSDDTMASLIARNAKLYEKYGVVIAVVTCDYGRDDLGSYVDKRGEEMNLGRRDFIVVLDIKGDNYWLGRGEDLAWDFTDDDCDRYAWNYMEQAFAGGDYDSAVLKLTQALEDWYGSYFR